MFEPKIGVATVVCLLTSFAVLACGDDESLEGVDASTSSTAMFPYLSEDYEPNCTGYTQRLRDCGILSDGPFACTEPTSSTGVCNYTCVTLASCAILSELTCGHSAALPLQECFAECEEFKCASGGAIVSSWVCDGQPDCADGSDEGECLTCGSGEVFPPSFSCDFYGDCLDGSDEIDCDGFHCGTGELIRESSACDLFVDCADGSDEANCDFFICENSAEPIRPHWQCDGTEDCLDGSDELGCAAAICPG